MRNWAWYGTIESDIQFIFQSGFYTLSALTQLGKMNANLIERHENIKSDTRSTLMGHYETALADYQDVINQLKPVTSLSL